MRIFIIGYMYSGKSTLGKRLAQCLAFPFFDTDALFEKQYQISISDFFATQGEAAFRQVERLILYQSLDYQDAIISVGGGLPCFFNNMAWMKSQGLVIFLHADAHTLIHRMKNASSSRPLLKNLSPEEAAQKIKSQLVERNSFYEQAHLIYPAENADAKDLARQIENYIRFSDTTLST